MDLKEIDKLLQEYYPEGIDKKEMGLTISSIFLVPPLDIKNWSVERLEHNFLNAYSKDKDLDVQYENAVYLLFKPKNMNKFQDFVDNQYEENRLILADYDPAPEYVVLVFQLDSYWNKDFE